MAQQENIPEKELVNPPTEMSAWTEWTCGHDAKLGDLYDITAHPSFTNLFESDRESAEFRASYPHSSAKAVFHLLTRSADEKCEACYKGNTCEGAQNDYQSPQHRQLIHPNVLQLLSADLPTDESEPKDPTPSVKMFQYHTEDTRSQTQALELRQWQQLNTLLNRKMTLSKCHQSFLEGKNAQVGVLYRKVNKTIKCNLCDSKTQPRNFEDLLYRIGSITALARKNITHLVNAIDYGVEIMFMFNCQRQEVQSLLRVVNTFVQYLSGEINKDELKEGNIFQEVTILDSANGKDRHYGLSLRSLLEETEERIHKILFRSSGRGFPIRIQLVDVDRALRKPFFEVASRSRPTVGYKFITDYKLGEHIDLMKMCGDVSKVQKNIYQGNSVEDQQAYTRIFWDYISRINDAMKNERKPTEIKPTGQGKKVTEVLLELDGFLTNIIHQLNNLRSQTLIREEELLGKGVRIFESSETDGDLFVFKYPIFSICLDSKIWNAHFAHFNNMLMLEGGREGKFYIEKSDHSFEICIQHIKNGEIICADILAEQQEKVELLTDANWKVAYKSVPVVYNDSESFKGSLGIACPMSSFGCCSIKRRNWRCKECTAILRYQLNNVQCLCGQVPLDDCRFLCSSMHETPLAPNQIQPPPKPMQEFSVLLLGDSGSGKTTFVNGVGNYLLHPNLDSALQGDRFFSDFKQASPTEDKQVEAQDNTSCRKTLKIQSFTFTSPTSEDIIIRIIDTPGYSKNLSPLVQQRELTSALSSCRRFNLHAITFFVDSFHLELSEQFRSNFQHVFNSFLERSHRNLFFILTNSEQGQPIEGFLPLITTLMSEQTTNQNVLEQAQPANQNVPEQPQIKKNYDLENFPMDYLRRVSKGTEITKAERDKAAGGWTAAERKTKEFLGTVSAMQHIEIISVLCSKERNFPALEDEFYLDNVQYFNVFGDEEPETREIVAILDNLTLDNGAINN